MESVLMGSIFVFSVTTLISYILIVLNIPYLIIPILILSIAVGYKSLIKTFKNTKISLNRQTFLVLVVFIIGIIGQLAVISPSGTYKSGDLVFWSAHGHDGTWHIALMEEMKKGYPFENPIFAGTPLKNYHFFSDILPTMVGKYTSVSNENLYFRIFPFFYSLFLGASVFFLTKKLTKNFSSGIWATVFTYFAGSFGYLIGKGESVFWATQIQSSSGNPPQIISNFLFLASIYFVLVYLEQKQKREKIKYFLIGLIMLGTISSFKIYAGVILLGTLSIVGTWELIKNKKIELFLLSLVSGILALILYLPNSSNSTSFLIYEPWWYIRTMIVEPSRLNLLDWELRRQTYIYESNWKRVIWLEGMGFLIFFFGNLGMRFLGLWEFVKTNSIFKIGIILSIAFPLIFLQKGVASNTSQFLQYFILLFGILAGIAVSKIVANKKFIFLAPIILILMIPTQVNLLREFYVSENHLRPAFAKVNSSELEALKFIKYNTDINSVILTPPYNQYLDQKQITPNIWDWFDTSYVSAFSSRRTYFDDYEQVDIMGYDYRPRLEIKSIIFDSEVPAKVSETLISTNANILYYPKAVAPKVNIESLGLVKFFENSEVIIWKIK
ncbi:MAG: hypothetical protein Q8Q30_02780 [Candidatus Woesebacteria bacterium]|nr:hypothetical protein [Candidatus Woesebacteria bacterium]